MIRHLLAALLLCLCIPCDRGVHTIKARPLSQKNPTSYVFPHPLPVLRQQLLTAFNDYQLMEGFYPSFNPNNSHFHFAVESREHAVFSEDVFARPENRDDVYLHSFGEWIDPSLVYFAGGEPLRYRAEFQLHLKALGGNSTEVSVITHKPAVINGSKCCGPHGYYSNDVAVEPTSIEEYKILLFIGRVLGASDMPPLRLPEGE